jgi:hypothetical protein
MIHSGRGKECVRDISLRDKQGRRIIDSDIVRAAEHIKDGLC